MSETFVYAESFVLQMCNRGKKLRRQSVLCHQTLSKAKWKHGIKGRIGLTDQFYWLWQGSFVVDRLIAPFRTTTKKLNLFGDHGRINGRRHMCVVHIVVHMNAWPRPARQLSLLWDLKSCHTSLSRHDFSYVPLRASGLLDAGTKDEGGATF